MVRQAAPAEAARPLTFPSTEGDGADSLRRMSRTGYASMLEKLRIAKQT